MNIPNTIKLFNQTIKVVMKRNLLDTHTCFGMWNYRKNTIWLQCSTPKHRLSKEQIEQTFIHELTHACLDMMGETELSENEQFVSAFSNLLHQVYGQCE